MVGQYFYCLERVNIVLRLPCILVGVRMTGNKCKNCGSAELEVDPARGDTICTNCGTVLEDSVIVSEMQFEENAHGGTSALGQFVASDSKGGCRGFGNNFHSPLNRESREITLLNAKRGISNLCQQLRLNQHCLDTAFNFYKMALTRQMTRGRKNTHVLAACVYITCRIEGTPHLLIDFSDVLQIDAFELGRCYLKLSQALCINIPALDPCLYVLRYANNLEFGEKTHEVAMTALRLVQRMKKDNIHYGRRPSGLCGAALLMAARLHDFSRTVGDIVKIVHIHESTLRKRLVEFGETPSSSLTLDEFMNVDLEEEQDPPSYKQARAKDRERAERLQKIMEEMETNNTLQISDLQVEIERQLEERRALKRPTMTESFKILSNVNSENVEEVDTDKFVAQSTLGVIQDCLDSGGNEAETAQPVGLGPSHALMGLEKKNETVPVVNCPFQDGTGELDLEGIDDKDIDQYIMSEHDAKNKDKIWMAMNATYLKEQKEKEERLAKEREEGKPEKKRRKCAGKKKNTPAANTAGEAIEKMLQEKKMSSKINYDVLKSLNISFKEDSSTNITPQETQKQTEPEIILPPPKSVAPSKRSKATPRIQKMKVEPKTEPIKIKEQLKEEVLPVLKTDSSVAGENSETEADMDMEEYEEEEVEAAEHTMSLSQMLNRHRADDNYYGYDDDDY
ncbi:transcription factor IIIB 90 kDa subunit isoform X2 [Homalodisca vitripennis]|uniref:transcription factor IIIB 90 kDa subunit isoform X2 n=1 Tax=Homalodisca vitripennis TaxID=197043 RepID=UPI001EEA15F8|nr:transcription factor IIIB 90 kDa subunit isoform X2 [Homalodisca vitripennis]